MPEFLATLTDPLASPLAASRIQFAVTMTFHILFPAISIGLAWALFHFKRRYSKTGDASWLEAYRFWIKIFALSFAIGVVTGVVMSFQFGTNWPGFMQRVGNVAGPLMAYEVLTAFFLEATFLGIMLFGTGRVSDRVHTLATLLVAIGTTLSAFWILALNSWMHTPTGFEVVDGKIYPTDWLAVIFSPSFPYRFTHMLLASALTVAFLVAGVSAYRWRRGDRAPEVKAAMNSGIRVAAVLIPLQILVGDLHGLNTFEHQPAKLAAMEAIWETERGAAAVLFAIPDEAAQVNRHELSIPRLASLYLGHDWNAEIRGLKEFPDAHPPVAPVFFGFRVMVGTGLLMLLVSWTAGWQIRRHGVPEPGMQRLLVGTTFIGWVAIIAGWYVTEIGRQPWVVQGVLSTADAVGQVPAGQVGLSVGMYVLLYLGLLLAFVSTLFYLARKAAAGQAPAKDPNPLIDPFVRPQPLEKPHA